CRCKVILYRQIDAVLARQSDVLEPPIKNPGIVTGKQRRGARLRVRDINVREVQQERCCAQCFFDESLRWRSIDKVRSKIRRREGILATRGRKTDLILVVDIVVGGAEPEAWGSSGFVVEPEC